jgi:hypothetical protein
MKKAKLDSTKWNGASFDGNVSFEKIIIITNEVKMTSE